MAGYFKFNDSEEAKPGKIKVISDHVMQVTLNSGDITPDLSGFQYALDEKMELLICDCSEYTTVFRQLESCIQYSNDESVYVEPEIIEEE